MNPATITSLAETLPARAGLPAPTRREEVRCWQLSGVERLHLPGGATAIFKYADPPLTGEARVLQHVTEHGLAVPRVLAAEVADDTLGMLLEDLGEPLREPTLAEAASAAVATHTTPAPDGLPVLDSQALAELPARCLASLAELNESGRWPYTDNIAQGLKLLAQLAERRAKGAELPPFGLVHSEFHPSSLYITADGWRLLDWARAFCGPGLVDLASWQPTRQPPDFATFGQLVDAYVAAGGPLEAAAPRGGLPPERWAYGWHRVWVIDWFLAQCTTWIPDPSRDPQYQTVVRRHLNEALTCLQT